MANNNIGFPSPMREQQQQVNTNGNAAAMNGVPMIAGQQMDVNFLYQKVCELSEVLRENRERTQAIISSAEELAVSTPTWLHGCAIQMSTKPSWFHWLIRHLILQTRAAANGAAPSLQEANAEISGTFMLQVFDLSETTALTLLI